MTWEKLFDLYEEVSKIAPPISHESSDNKYGIGSDNVYGHVKVHSNIDNNTAKQDDTASISAIKSYVTSSIKPNLSDINEINKDTNEENTLLTISAIKQLITQSINNIKSTLTISDIKLNDSEDTLENKIEDIEVQIGNYSNTIDLSNPIEINEDNTDIININYLKEPGYYYYNKEYNSNNSPLKYNNVDVCHKKSLVIVEKQPNGIIIQRIYSTDDIEYNLDGTEYIRFFKDTWSDLSIRYKPTTNYTISTTKSETLLTCKENTAGFIITWKQNNEDNSYLTSDNLYEYETIGTFTYPIPIGDTPYIFSNLIGKIDIKVSKNNIQVRSTLKESKIKNVNVTFFIPRLE